MMNYQLPTGKTVCISFEDWLNLTDEKIQDMIAKDAGIEVDDPFSNFSYKERKPNNYQLPPIEGVEPIDEEIIEEIKKQIDGNDI